jgi:hypothetical protein
MRQTTIHCDICSRKISQLGWQEMPYSLTIKTHCVSHNPMARITTDAKFQENTYHSDDICSNCMNDLAETIANRIEKIKKLTSKENILE